MNAVEQEQVLEPLALQQLLGQAPGVAGACGGEGAQDEVGQPEDGDQIQVQLLGHLPGSLLSLCQQQQAGAVCKCDSRKLDRKYRGKIHS